MYAGVHRVVASGEDDGLMLAVDILGQDQKQRRLRWVEVCMEV